MQEVCPGSVVAHGQLPSDPAVTGLVLGWTAPGPPAAGADCATLRAAGGG